MKKLFSIISIIFYTTLFFSQKITIFSGKVVDTIGDTVPFSNIVLIPQDTLQKKIYGITNENGHFKISVISGIKYYVQISSIGFKTLKFSIQDTSYKFQTYILMPDVEVLDEVKITYEKPIKEKGDTLIYKIEKFISGKELKLKNVLKKLPGVIVKENGEVIVAGKRISQILVDGKPFFNGDTKFSIENIPANVIESLEVLKNYHPIDYMKNVEKTSGIINVKLKKNKKRFVFGNILAGGGIREKYIFQPKAFYFSPKTSLSLIGDYNNTGEQNFSMSDLLKMERMLTNTYNDETKKLVLPLSNSKDFLSRKINLSGFQINKDLGSKMQFNAYIINIDERFTTSFSQKIQYLFSGDTEKINTNNTTKANIFYGKFKLLYKPKISEHLFYTLSLINHKLLKIKNNEVFFNTNSLLFENQNTQKNKVLHAFQWYKKINRKNIIKLIAYQLDEINNGRLKFMSNYPVLSSFISFQTDTLYYINQNENKKSVSYFIHLKHYFKYKRKFHIYTSFQYNYTSIFFKSSAFFRSERTDSNLFSLNNFPFIFKSYQPGLQFRFKILNSKITSAIFVKYSVWGVPNSPLKNNFSILPKLNFERDILKGRLEISYELKPEYPQEKSFLDQALIINRNQLFLGNSDINPALNNNLKIKYHFFNLERGLTFMYESQISQHINRIKNHVKYINNTEAVKKYINLNNKENSVNNNILFALQKKKWSFQFYSNILHEEFYTIISNSIHPTTQNMFFINLSIDKNFLKFLTLKSGFRFFHQQLLQENDISVNREWMPYFNLTFILNNIKFNFKYNIYILKTSNFKTSPNSQLEFKIEYFKENSPFIFEFYTTNLLNSQVKNSIFSDPLITISKNKYIQERTITLRIRYRF